MDIKTLEVFRDLTKRLNFTQSSHAMHMSLSALSRTIVRLEEELGVSLFRRDNRKVVLTRAGQDFCHYADKALNDYYNMRKELAKLQPDNTAVSGELTLFCTVTAAHVYVPNLFNTFRRRYPNAELKLITGDASLATSMVKKGEVDFAFAGEDTTLGQEYIFHKVDDIPCSVIAPTAHSPFSELLDENPIPWDRIPFVMPESGPLFVATNDWFRQMGIKQPGVYAKVTGHEAIVSMTSLGCGLSIIPDPVLELSPLHQTVRTIPVPVKPPTLVLGILGLQKHLSTPLRRAFWALGEEIFN